MSLFEEKLHDLVSNFEDEGRCAVVIEQWVFVITHDGNRWEIDELFDINSPIASGVFVFPFQSKKRLLRWEETGFGILLSDTRQFSESRISKQLGFSTHSEHPYHFRYFIPIGDQRLLKQMSDRLSRDTVPEDSALQTLTLLRAEFDSSLPRARMPMTMVIVFELPHIEDRGSFAKPSAPSEHRALEHVASVCAAVQAKDFQQFVFDELMMSAYLNSESDEWELFSLDLIDSSFALPGLLWVQRTAQFHGASLDPGGFGITRNDHDSKKDDARMRALQRQISHYGTSVVMCDTYGDLVVPCLGHLADLFDSMLEVCRSNHILQGVEMFHRLKRDVERTTKKPASAKAPPAASTYSSFSRGRQSSNVSPGGEPLRIWRIGQSSY